MFTLQFIDHVQLLSSAIYVLLKEKVTTEEIIEIESKLDNFVKSFVEFNGPHNVTMNLHLLRHIPESVRNSGPLWSNSAFSFESNNGELIRSNKAKINILHTMAWKYALKPTIDECIDVVNIDENIQLKEECFIKFSPSEKLTLESSNFRNLNEISTYKILKIRSVKFSSLAAKELQTADFFVELDIIKSKMFQPETLIADGADAIRNGFYNTFDSAKLDVMCFAHVIRNIRKRPFASKNNKPLILDDIRKMQSSSSRQMFEMMTQLFCDKWQCNEPNFVEYLKKQWLGIHSNGFEGAAEYTPSTNNALESHNAVMKRKVTLRIRLPKNQFLSAMNEMTSSISIQFSTGLRIISIEPTMKEEMINNAVRIQMFQSKKFKREGVRLFDSCNRI